MALKISRSETKSALTSKKKPNSKKTEDSGLFSRLLGISGSEPVQNKETEFHEINHISEAISAEERAEIDALIVDIENAGNELISTPIYPNVVKYKLLIQKFMGKIISSSFEVQKKTGRKSIMEEKIYSVVKKVDAELEQLSESVLNQQIDNIKLVNKLDEIRGLLIDLYK